MMKFSLVIDSMKENRRLQIPLIAAGYILAAISGFLLLREDFVSLLRWDLGLVVLGLLALPVTAYVLKPFEASGYIFSRVIGLCIASYVIYLLSAFRIVRFNAYNSVLVLFVLIIVIYLLTAYIQKNGLRIKLPYNLNGILLAELVFLLILICTTWWLGHKISATETERLMDLAFMETINKSDYLPPVDLWCAGEKLNYYYYGQYMCTLVGKIASVNMEYAYSLSMSTLFTFSIVLTYIISNFLLKHTGLNKYASAIGGLISSLAVSIAGNCHYIVFYKLVPTLWDMLKIDGDKPTYWFASSTRYIGYNPVNSSDMTISEFPIYSFLLGDLHAHVIDIMVVLTLLAVVISYAFGRANSDADEQNIIKRIFNPNLIMCMFLIAIASMTNYWDFAIYFVVCGSVILLTNVVKSGFSLKTIGITLLEGALFYVVISLLNMKFMSQFEKMFNGIGIVTSRSYFHQLLILWGLPITLVIVFAIWHVVRCLREGIRPDFIDDIIFMISGCAIGLVLLPEFIFAKDIYINGYPRANTMFKLTYEAFILFGISMGYIIVRIICSRKREDQLSTISLLITYRKIRSITIICSIILLFTMFYSATASRMWMGSFKDVKYKGLDASATIRDNLGDESKIVDYINDNLPGQEVILVADGLSYTDNCTIPALTGHPTVFGWLTHEQLWHNSMEYPNERLADIRNIYLVDDLDSVKECIDKYDIRYIYIGSKEYEKYPDMNVANVLSLGDVVYFDSSNYYYLVEVER